MHFHNRWKHGSVFKPLRLWKLGAALIVKADWKLKPNWKTYSNLGGFSPRAR